MAIVIYFLVGCAVLYALGLHFERGKCAACGKRDTYTEERFIDNQWFREEEVRICRKCKHEEQIRKWVNYD